MTFAYDVGLLGHSGLTEVDMRIDDAWQEPACRFSIRGSLLYLGNTTIGSDDKVAMDQMTFSEDTDIAYNCG